MPGLFQMLPKQVPPHLLPSPHTHSPCSGQSEPPRQHILQNPSAIKTVSKRAWGTWSRPPLGPHPQTLSPFASLTHHRAFPRPSGVSRHSASAWNTPPSFLHLGTPIPLSDSPGNACPLRDASLAMTPDPTPYLRSPLKQNCALSTLRLSSLPLITAFN